MIVYKITNTINSRIYIGQTVRSLTQRWKEHCRNSNKSIISKAIQKYGKENFKIEEIDGANSLSELNYKEWLLIYKFNSLAPNGYNLQTGGNSKGKLSKLSKQKISNSHKGKEGYGRRPIICLNNNTIYNSISGAEKYLKVFDIWNHLVQNKYHVRGLVFKYIDDWDGIPWELSDFKQYYTIINKVKFTKTSLARKGKNGKHFSKKVICLNNGCKYNSMTNASEELNIPSNSKIGQVCLGKKRHINGLVFKYIDDWDNNLWELSDFKQYYLTK